MTKGADIIAGIILVALAIAIIVYLLHWLYRRSSKEVSFVRTGMMGEKVVISGGAFVLPIIHNITQVGMRTLSLNIIYNLADVLNKIIFGMIIYSAALEDTKKGNQNLGGIKI